MVSSVACCVFLAWVGLTTRKVQMLIKSENSTVAVSTGINALVPVPGPELPRAFSPTDEAALRKLQDRHGMVTRVEGNAVRRRALLLRDQHRFMQKYGVASINAYAFQIRDTRRSPRPTNRAVRSRVSSRAGSYQPTRQPPRSRPLMRLPDRSLHPRNIPVRSR